MDPNPSHDPPIAAKRILIYGSCVSRDMFGPEHARHFKVVDYVARSSLASAFQEKEINDRFSENISSSFQRRLVQLDLHKGLRAILANTEFDILLIDFIDERFGVFSLANGEICTLSQELLNGGFDKKCESGQEIPAGTDAFMTLWEHGWAKMLDLLSSRNCAHKIRINKVYWATHRSDGNPLPRTVNGVSIAAGNALLDALYARAARNLPARQFITYPRELFVGDINHQWGVSPFHFVPEVYSHARRSLEADESTGLPGHRPTKP